MIVAAASRVIVSKTDGIRTKPIADDSIFIDLRISAETDTIIPGVVILLASCLNSVAGIMISFILNLQTRSRVMGLMAITDAGITTKFYVAYAAFEGADADARLFNSSAYSSASLLISARCSTDALSI